jgi:hypothetical protein
MSSPKLLFNYDLQKQKSRESQKSQLIASDSTFLDFFSDGSNFLRVLELLWLVDT